MFCCSDTSFVLSAFHVLGRCVDCDMYVNLRMCVVVLCVVQVNDDDVKTLIKSGMADKTVMSERKHDDDSDGDDGAVVETAAERVSNHLLLFFLLSPSVIFNQSIYSSTR